MQGSEPIHLSFSRWALNSGSANPEDLCLCLVQAWTFLMISHRLCCRTAAMTTAAAADTRMQTQGCEVTNCCYGSSLVVDHGLAGVNMIRGFCGICRNHWDIFVFMEGLGNNTVTNTGRRYDTVFHSCFSSRIPVRWLGQSSRERWADRDSWESQET